MSKAMKKQGRRYRHLVDATEIGEKTTHGSFTKIWLVRLACGHHAVIERNKLPGGTLCEECHRLELAKAARNGLLERKPDYSLLYG